MSNRLSFPTLKYITATETTHNYSNITRKSLKVKKKLQYHGAPKLTRTGNTYTGDRRICQCKACDI